YTENGTGSKCWSVNSKFCGSEVMRYASSNSTVVRTVSTLCLKQPVKPNARFPEVWITLFVRSLRRSANSLADAGDENILVSTKTEAVLYLPIINAFGDSDGPINSTDLISSN